ncbi:Rieske 2Fe-2S domain-containing protein [Streptomyces sp. NPDC090108]|uniref:Rieske 2Fe-2S domain-containing protein n=1 Tax=Streptomyces sp. NPDC090108 TaxID=3365947 RepID=UPI00382FB2B2
MRKLIEDVIDDIGKTSSLDGVCGKTAGLVSRATSGDLVKNALSGTWFGHPLHPALSDLPIGAWVMASAVDVTMGRSGAGAARRLVALGLLSAVPTAWSGWSDWADTYGPTQRVGYVHAVGNATGAALQAASWVARARGRRGAGMALSGLGLGITACAAYLGGHLSFVKGVGVNHTAFEEPATEWTDVESLSVLGENELRRVTVKGVPVVLVRHDGEVYALSATCTHAGGPLDEGKVLPNGCVQCPWHGSEFRLSDGEAVRGPASVDEPRWDVKIDSGRVLVRAAAS